MDGTYNHEWLLSGRVTQKKNGNNSMDFVNEKDIMFNIIKEQSNDSQDEHEPQPEIDFDFDTDANKCKMIAIEKIDIDDILK